ncbi:MAG: desulfoferrodoxin family protein [Candidatus Woesearchaeota archaeon]|jgi:superoxide reductase
MTKDGERMMTKEDEIYRCNVCGNIVSVEFAGGGTLVCCGQDMELLKEKTLADEGKEKHVPVVTVSGKIVTVKVGSIEHPMEAGHFITLIQIFKSGKIVAEKKLYPGEKPIATFEFEDVSGISVREVCNKHGLWRS